MWSVYIVRCANQAFYTGITTDLKRRVKQHNTNRGAGYTRGFGPVRLVWSEPQPDRSSALKREAQIKKWPRAKKKTLLSTKKDKDA